VRRQFYIRVAVAAFVLCIVGSVAAQSQQQRGVDPAVTRLGSGFAFGMVTVNGTSLYFVRGGSGTVDSLYFSLIAGNLTFTTIRLNGPLAPARSIAQLVFENGKREECPGA
jgi:hypothetical protein